MVEDSDPVTVGIREWQKVKQAAEDAIERARKAEEEVSYYRGQNELLISQRKADEAQMRLLQQHADEMTIMVDALGAAVLSTIEKRKAGFFRRAGSIKNGRDRFNAVQTDVDENLRELARRLDPKPEPARQVQPPNIQ